MGIAELIPAYVQAVAILLAGMWAYWRFFHQQNHEPATDIDIEVRMVGTHGDNHVLEVTAILENKSLVRHKYENFRMNMRYLRAGDELMDGNAGINFQLYFPHSIDMRISGERRYFGNVGYINPRQRFQHRYETFVPRDAAFVLVHCKFLFHTRSSVKGLLRTFRPDGRVFVDAQRVIRIP